MQKDTWDVHGLHRKTPTQEETRASFRMLSTCSFFYVNPHPGPFHTNQQKRVRGSLLLCFLLLHTAPSPCTPSLALTGVCSEAPGFAAAALSGAVGYFSSWLQMDVLTGSISLPPTIPTSVSRHVEPFGCLLGVQNELLSGAPVNKHIQSGALALSDALDKVVC